MLATLDVKLNDTGFKIAMVLVGAGGGLLASQLGNVIMSSTDASKASETGGLQGTALNLGASIGTALIGAILILNLINGFNATSPTTRRCPPRPARRSPPNRGGHRHRAGRPGRATGPFEGPLGGPGQGSGGRLQRTPSSTRCGSPSAQSRPSRCSASGSRGSCRRPPSRPRPSRTARRRRHPPDPFGPAAGKPPGDPNRRRWPRIPARGETAGGRSDCRGSAGERWGQFAGRVANAFGLVLLLVLATYVLGSLTAFHGWTAVLTTLVACAGRRRRARRIGRAPDRRPRGRHARAGGGHSRRAGRASRRHSPARRELVRDRQPPAARGGGDPACRPDGDRGGISHDPGRDQRLHDPGTSLQLPLRGAGPGGISPLLRPPASRSRAATSSSSASPR